MHLYPIKLKGFILTIKQKNDKIIVQGNSTTNMVYNIHRKRGILI